MATIEQRDKHIATEQKRIEKATPRVEKLTETLANYDAKVAERREKLTKNLATAKVKLDRATAARDWWKSAPVDGQLATDAPESDDTDDDETGDDTDESADDGDPEPAAEPARQRDPRTGHFLPVGASA